MDELIENIESLEQASKTPARNRSIDIAIIRDEIAEYANQNGLPNHLLQRLVAIVTVKTELDQNTLTTLVKNLFPSDHVPNEVVTAVVGALGTSKTRPPAAVQVGLVKWLYAVLDAGVIEEPSSVSRFYAVFFSLLDLISLRAALCQILALITRRKHVKPFRVQRLFELSQQVGSEAALLQLLQVYKHYQPEIIIGNVTSRSSGLLSQANIEWRQRLQTIQSFQPTSTKGAQDAKDGFTVARTSARNRSNGFLPDVHSYYPSNGTMTLEEVRGVADFVANLERLDPPSQIVAGLRDPLLQKYLLLVPSGEAQRRLNFWLAQYFEQELDLLKEGFGLSPTLKEVLSAIASYTVACKTINNVVEQFLRMYLPLWDGSSNLGAITDIIAYASIQPFQDLHLDLLSHVERAIIANAHDPYQTIFDLYTNLANRWVRTLTMPRMNASAPSDYLTIPSLIAMFQHTCTIAQTALAATTAGTTAVPNPSILRFYETFARNIREALQLAISGSSTFMTPENVIPIVLPPANLLYLLAHSPSLSSLSSVCSLLGTYKQAFNIGVKLPGSDRDNIHQFNCYMMDVLNLLYRSKALSAADSHALGCLISASVSTELQDYVKKLDREYHLFNFFGPPYHPLLCAMSQSAVTAAEEQRIAQGEELQVRHAGPVTQQSLKVLANSGGMDLNWKDYRVLILDFLAERGVDGVKSLVYSTMKDMMK